MELRTRSTVMPDVDVPSSADDALDFLLNARPVWHAQAACHGETFTMYDNDPVSLRRAAALCRSCPVAHECAQAGQREHYGVWGGVAKYRGRERKYVHANGQPVKSLHYIDLFESMPDQWFTATEVAERLKVSQRSAMRMCSQLTGKGLIAVDVGGRNDLGHNVPNRYQWKGTT